MAVQQITSTTLLRRRTRVQILVRRTAIRKFPCVYPNFFYVNDGILISPQSLPIYNAILSEPVFDSRQVKNCSLLLKVQTTSGPPQASYWTGSGRRCPTVKRPGHEGDHSPLSSVAVKNKWNYTSITLHATMAYTDNCTCSLNYGQRMHFIS
jgi:hypothetical protein